MFYRACSAVSRLVVEMLIAAHASGKLSFFGEHAGLSDVDAFTAFLAPLKRCEWVVCAKQPFSGPEAVLAYLSLYTHRVAAIDSNHRHHDAQQQAKPDARQNESEQIVTNVTKREVHFAPAAAIMARRPSAMPGRCA